MSTDFKAWKAKLMKTLSILYSRAETQEMRLDIHATIEQLRYMKSRDASTILYLLHTLRAKHNLHQLDEFIETIPVEEK